MPRKSSLRSRIPEPSQLRQAPRETEFQQQKNGLIHHEKARQQDTCTSLSSPHHRHCSSLLRCLRVPSLPTARQECRPQSRSEPISFDPLPHLKCAHDQLLHQPSRNCGTHFTHDTHARTLTTETHTDQPCRTRLRCGSRSRVGALQFLSWCLARFTQCIASLFPCTLESAIWHEWQHLSVSEVAAPSSPPRVWRSLLLRHRAHPLCFFLPRACSTQARSASS